MRLGSQVWPRAWAALPSMQQWQHLYEQKDSRLDQGFVQVASGTLKEPQEHSSDTPFLACVPRTARKHLMRVIYQNVRRR